MTNSGTKSGTIPVQNRETISHFTCDLKWHRKATGQKENEERGERLGRNRRTFTCSFIHFWVVFFFDEDALIFNVRKLIKRPKNK